MLSFCKVNFADFWIAFHQPGLDYTVDGILQQTINKTSNSNINTFQAAINAELTKMTKDILIKVFK